RSSTPTATCAAAWTPSAGSTSRGTTRGRMCWGWGTEGGAPRALWRAGRGRVGVTEGKWIVVRAWAERQHASRGFAGDETARGALFQPQLTSRLTSGSPRVAPVTTATRPERSGGAQAIPRAEANVPRREPGAARRARRLAADPVDLDRRGRSRAARARGRVGRRARARRGRGGEAGHHRRRQPAGRRRAARGRPRGADRPH